MPIDEETLTDVSVENGKVFSDGNRTLLLGWAVPGVDDRRRSAGAFHHDRHGGSR